MQKKLFDIGGSDENECQACHNEEGTEKHTLCPCPEWQGIRSQIPETSRKWRQKAKTSTKEWKWQRGIVAHPLSESQWNRGYVSMKKLESEKRKNWGLPAEGFKGHVATDGSSLGRAGKWGACGWAVCSWIVMRRWGPYMGCMAPWKQILRSSQASKRTELTAFLCLLNGVIGPLTVHVDNKGIIDGLRRGERECTKPRVEDADLWMKIWEDFGLRSPQSFLSSTVTKCSKCDISFFSLFVRCALTCSTSTIISLAAKRWKPKEKWTFVDQKREETKHRTEWCAEASRYRCKKCGKSSKHMKMPGKCARPKFLSTNFRKW